MGIQINVPYPLEDKFLVTARNKNSTQIAALALPQGGLNVMMNDGAYSFRHGALLNALFATRPEQVPSENPTSFSSYRKYRWGSFEYQDSTGLQDGRRGLLQFIDDYVSTYSGRLTIERTIKSDFLHEADGWEFKDPETGCCTYVTASDISIDREIAILGRGTNRHEGLPIDSKDNFMRAFRSYVKIVSDVLEGLYQRVGLELGSKGYDIILPEFVEHRDRDAVDLTAMKRYLEVSTSGTTFESVAGLESLKEELRNMCLAVRDGLYYRLEITPPSGILLHGPPGNGKTLLARAVAHECGMQFLNVNIPAIVSSYTGRTQLRLDAIRKIAEGIPTILYFDEVDAIARRRGDARDERLEILSQLLTMMDGMVRSELPNIFMGSTNRIKGLDPAFLRPGRFTLHYKIPNPDETARRKILDLHLQRVAANALRRCEINILPDQLDLEEVIAATAGEASSFLAEVARKTVERVYVFGAVEEGSVPTRAMTPEDLVETVKVLKDNRTTNGNRQPAGFKLY